jgi:hypothetical protein
MSSCIGTGEIVRALAFASWGIWWAVAPQSVIRLHVFMRTDPESPSPNPLTIRIVGLAWILLIVGMVVW